MFSRFKKPEQVNQKPATVAVGSGAPQTRATVAPAPSTSIPKIAVVTPKSSAELTALDKERKKKEKLSELKVELHKRLLENLNLAALESATEGNLKAEIAAIVSEALEEMSVVMN
jgi:pilus assembly protein CpaF